MAMLDLKKTLARMLNTPLVVEHGTSGIWTYRKWSDGTAECWGTHNMNQTAANKHGSVYYVSFSSITFPTGLFIEMPTITATANKISGGGMPFVSITVLSKTSFNGFLADPNNSTYSTNVFFHAKGKWK